MSLASLCAVAVMALGAAGAAQRVGRQPQRFGCTVGAGLGLSTDRPARYEVVGAGPFRRARADLTDQFQGGAGVHTVDADQVHSGHPVKLPLDVETRRVLLMALLAVGSRRLAVATVL